MSFWDKMRSSFAFTVNKRTIKENQIAEEVRASLNAYENIWVDGFVDPEQVQVYKSYYHSLYSMISKKVDGFLFTFGFVYKSFQNEAKEFVSKYEGIDNELIRYNDAYAAKKIEEAKQLIFPVEGRELDEQQLKCIVKPSKNHLVLAGAGTGKTTTIIGYIKYLLKTEMFKPENMLVLSFTNASASEMQERVFKETNIRMDISTFHKLGLNIMSKVEGKKPNISEVSLREFCSNQLNELIKDNRYLNLLLHYLIYGVKEVKSEFEFKDKREYDEYIANNSPISIDKKRLKSFGEVDIANFLYQHNVKYEYEKAYFIDTRTEEYGQYYPDFYLPDYNLYIEYFGINREGNVPDFFSSRPGKTATEDYQSSMKWKRNLHKEHDTKMIEIYAYERLEQTHLIKLKNELLKTGVQLTPKDPETLMNDLWGGRNEEKERLADLFGTIISLIKSNDSTIQEIHERNAQVKGPKSNDIALKLVQPIYDAYQKSLKDNHQIDFNDMINQACRYIENGDYQHHYDMVIIDEYQDISQSRFKLLYEMRKQKDYQLFCVGDDWQSIYRFSGSDIGFILNFEKYWGASTIDRIETTYRFTDKLIEITGSFIMQNPEQKKKALKSKQQSEFYPLEKIQGYNETYAINFMVSKLKNLPKDATVLFLGRYRFDLNLLRNHPELKVKYNALTQKIEVTHPDRPDLNMSFMSVHQSKGLQAEYVFILNNKNIGLGFPSKISNPPILKLLLDDCDFYPFAEERRLFYVAMTRAKKKVFLVTIKDNESSFVKELTARYGNEMKKEQYRCPECGGMLQRKQGKYGDFLGCSNYSKTGCNYIRKIYNAK